MSSPSNPSTNGIEWDSSVLEKSSLDDLTIEYDKATNYSVAYECNNLVPNNQLAPVKVEYYYDLLREKDDDEKDVVKLAENALLESVAIDFGLQEGLRCTAPPTGAMWLVRISSWPRDSIVDAFDSCQSPNLQPGVNQVCNVYKGTMTGFALGDVDETNLIQFIELEMRRENDPKYKISFLGTQIDTSIVSSRGKERLKTPMNFVEKYMPFQIERNRSVTWIGGLLLAAFALLIIGVFTVLYQRRRRWVMAQEAELALSKSIDDYQGSPSKYSNVVIQPIEVGTISRDDSTSDGGGISPTENDGGYTFDLGASMRHDLFGIHGRGGPSRNPFGHTLNGMEELASESDADSWAQTDGTIGSLELQLEPITAEV